MSGHEVIRVLESFHRPQPTTNPYIVQLARSIEAHPDLGLQYFSYAQALRGGYDLFHVHWPEQLMGGHTRRGRSARRLLCAALLARLRATGTPIVRTWHNTERPTELGRIDNLLLDQIDRLTRLRITLNDVSVVPPDALRVTILHGHYSDWFRDRERQEDQPGHLVYAGLIRRYKGVERLLEQFRLARSSGLSLHVAGKPSTPELAEHLRALAEDQPSVTLHLDFLDDDEFVRAVTRGRAVILPYRHMHNSGTVLASLSLGRPVLVPDNEVNRRLSEEVGPGWVHTYTGDLTAEDLDRLAAALEDGLPDRPPDLSRRSWESAGAQHAAAFRAVLAAPRRPGAGGTT